MAGYDPSQPRDEEGQWTIAGNAAWAASGVVSDRAKRFAARMNDGRFKQHHDFRPVG